MRMRSSVQAATGGGAAVGNEVSVCCIAWAGCAVTQTAHVTPTAARHVKSSTKQTSSGSRFRKPVSLISTAGEDTRPARAGSDYRDPTDHRGGS